jgi:tubulin polyglutamylase TTLL6/13
MTGVEMLARKKTLAMVLNAMKEKFPEEYSFYPKTWLLPEEYGVYNF